MPGTTAFPAGLDTFPAIGPNTSEAAPGVEHDVVHENVHAAVAALQVKVGINGSQNATTVDARLAAVETGKEPAFAAGTAAQYRRGDKTWQTLDKAAVGLGNVDNTSDATKPISTAQATALAAKADLVGGKVPTAQLPSVSIGETFTAASQAAMVDLSAQIGDVAIRSDQGNRKYILLGDSTVAADWKPLDASGLPVDSVNGMEGAVVLAKADIGLGNVDNTSDANKPVSTAQAAADAALIIDSIADGDTTHAPSRNAVFDALALKAVIPKGYIDGLQLQWVSGTALTISSGAAYIEASGNIVSAPSAIAKTGLALATSTWYHVYLYLNAGTPDIEIVTTAPAAAYSGTARSKTGDMTRRYLGSVRTDAGANIFNFLASGDHVAYRVRLADAPFRVLNGGTATTETTVAMTNVVPITSRACVVRFANLCNVNVWTGTSDDSASGPPSGGINGLAPGEVATVPHPLDTSQAMTYWLSAAASSGAFYVDVTGYWVER